MITRLAYAFVILCASPADDNLLANPGFDDLDGRGNPKKWDSFVMPMEGAYGRIDDIALSGAYSVTLHIPEPYTKDPLNNWSQNILANLGGQQLVISGNIKTEKATEAAILIQCFQKTPLRILASKTSSADTPLYGTHNWTPIKMEIDVPLDTDFLVLRCILRGRGTAWFDDTKVAKKSAETPKSTPASAPPETDDNEVAPPMILEDLERANAFMQEILDSLQEGNARLKTEIYDLQKELTEFRQELTTGEAWANDLNEVPPPPPIILEPHEPKGHPLVPSAPRPKETQ